MKRTVGESPPFFRQPPDWPKKTKGQNMKDQSAQRQKPRPAADLAYQAATIAAVLLLILSAAA